MSLILRVDALVQRRFDQLAHAVMRKTGASKRMMRRGGWNVVVTALVLWLSVTLLEGLADPLGQSVNLLVYAGLRYCDDIDDRRAEQSNMRAHADSNATSRKMTGLMLLAVTLLAAGWWAFWGVVLMLSWLYQGYLCRTSPRVPPQKEREPKLVLVSCAEVA